MWNRFLAAKVPIKWMCTTFYLIRMFDDIEKCTPKTNLLKVLEYILDCPWKSQEHFHKKLFASLLWSLRKFNRIIEESSAEHFLQIHAKLANYVKSNYFPAFLLRVKFSRVNCALIVRSLSAGWAYILWLLLIALSFTLKFTKQLINAS